MTTYRAVAFSPSGVPLGRIEEIGSIDLSWLHNIPSGFSLSVSKIYRDMLVEDGRVIIYRNNGINESPVLSGLIEPRSYSKSGPLDISGVGFLKLMEEEYAVPDIAGYPYTGSAYNVRSGPAETVIKGYVNYNIGPLAGDGRDRGITIETDAASGGTVKESARFDNLLEMCQRLARIGGVGMRFVEQEFQIFVPEDKTSSVVFTEKRENLLDYFTTKIPAKVNFATIGGQGQGIARTFLEGSDNPALVAGRRKAVFADRRDTNDTEIHQGEIDEILDKNKAQTIKTAIVRDKKGTMFFDDYFVGTKVTEWDDDDGTTQDVIQAIRISYANKEETIELDIGTSALTEELYSNEKILDKRLKRLEAA